LRGFKLGVDVATARWGFYPSASTTGRTSVAATVVQDPMVDGLAHCLRSSWQGRCCEGAAVKALLCRRFLAGLPGVPPEQCHRLHLREPRVPRTPCGAPITTPRGRSFPHSRIGLLADFMLVQALLLPANLEQGHYCMPTSGPRRHVGQG